MAKEMELESREIIIIFCVHRFGFVGIFSYSPVACGVYYYSWNQSSIHQMIPHRYVSHRSPFYSFLYFFTSFPSATLQMLVVEVGNKMKLTFQFYWFLWTVWHPSRAHLSKSAFSTHHPKSIIPSGPNQQQHISAKTHLSFMTIVFSSSTRELLIFFDIIIKSRYPKPKFADLMQSVVRYSLFAILGSFVALWKWFTFYSRKVCFVKLLLIFFHIFVLRCIATNDAQRPKAKQKKEPTERKKMEVTRQHYLVVASKVATTAPATIPSSTKRKQWIMNLRSVAIAISLASKSLAPAQSVSVGDKFHFFFLSLTHLSIPKQKTTKENCSWKKHEQKGRRK